MVRVSSFLKGSCRQTCASVCTTISLRTYGTLTAVGSQETWGQSQLRETEFSLYALEFVAMCMSIIFHEIS